MPRRCRAFQYLLSPTVKQERTLVSLLGEQCRLYNAALEERQLEPALLAFGVTVARGTVLRLDRAFQGFFRRTKAGRAPGFPRFRSARRFDSVEWPDASGWNLDESAARLYVRGVGHVKLRLHRSLRGTPKTMAGEAVAALHPKIANQRRDFLHKQSRTLVNDHDVIVIEDLRVTNMIRRPKPVPDEAGGFTANGAAAKAGLNKSILDAGWGRFRSMLNYKAEEAGSQLVVVNPRHSSQTCGHCGHIDKDNRHGTVFQCVSCGHHDNADVNAAVNILRAGLAQRLAREAKRAVA